MAAVPQRAMTTGEWGLLLLLSLLWGGSFFFIGVAVKELPPLTIVAARVSLAAALLWLTAPLTGLSPGRVRAAAPALVVLGLVNNAIPFTLIVWGQTHLASGLASILNATTPVITVIAAHFLTASERLNARRLAGALCGFLGVAWMIGPDLARRPRRQRRGRARGARRRAVLRPGEHLRAAVSAASAWRRST